MSFYPCFGCEKIVFSDKNPSFSVLGKCRFLITIIGFKQKISKKVVDNLFFPLFDAVFPYKRPFSKFYVFMILSSNRMLYGAGICPKLFSPLFVPFSLEHSWLFSVSPRAHFTSRVSRTGQFHETVSVSYAFHAILQRLTRSLPKTNFSIRDINVSRELKSFVFLRIGDSKCRPIPFFSSKRAFDALFSSSRTKDIFRF